MYDYNLSCSNLNSIASTHRRYDQSQVDGGHESGFLQGKHVLEWQFACIQVSKKTLLTCRHMHARTHILCRHDTQSKASGSHAKHNYCHPVNLCWDSCVPFKHSILCRQILSETG